MNIVNRRLRKNDTDKYRNIILIQRKEDIVKELKNNT